MSIEKYRHPFLFYGLAIAIPWTLWLAAAYLSHITPMTPALIWAASGLGVAGLIAPFLIAWRLIWLEPGLRDDLKRRIFGFTGTRPVYWFLACFLMLASILLAQAISLLFGHSVDQFHLSGKNFIFRGHLPRMVHTYTGAVVGRIRLALLRQRLFAPAHEFI